MMGKFDDNVIDLATHKRNKFADVPEVEDFAQGTVARLVARYVKEMDSLESRPPLGVSHKYTLWMLQRAPIGAVLAKELTKHHVIEHCKERIKTVCAATINQDVTYLGGVLKYAPSAWEDCEDISDAAVAAAKPFLVKHGYISKSTPRKRVPTDEEIARLLAFFEIPPKKRPKSFIYAMPDMIAFALVSSRRISEICSIKRSDIDWKHKDEQGNPAPMYLVRNMKHPKKKIGNHKRFPLFPELAEIVQRQPVKEGDDRVFPFNPQSVGAKYTHAKKALGIENLRFHDNRREAITRWLKKMTPHQVRHYVSGHENTLILERNYDATDPAEGHAVLRQPAAA